MEYYDKDTLTSETTTRKDCLKFTAAQPLKEGTVYRIEISGELTGNSSNFLGINQIVYFKTAGGQDAPEPDDPGSDNPSKSGSGSDPIVIDPLNPEPVLTDTGITIKSAEAKSPSRQLPVNTQLIVKPIDVSVSDASGKQLSYLEEKTPFAFVADLNDIENLNSIMIYVLVDGAWVYIPSVADAETGKITVSTHHVGEFIICRNTLVEQLTDLADDKYLEPIKTLIALGLVEGITQSDGTMAFDGEENLEIADFAKILCGVLRIGVSTVDIGAGNGLFADWDATPLLAKMYILALYNSGVFEGINEDGRLYAGAEQLLTGEQMFVLLCRGLEIDYTEDESWAGDARNSLDLLGLVDPAMADATAPCTRKEMAYTVGLLLQLLSEDELDDAIAQAAAATPDEDEPDADEVHEES